jgi:quinoprotein glucose dehydrogenase
VRKHQVLILLTAGVLAALALASLHAQEIGWIAYGRDVEGTRYLPSTGINRENVAQLEPAWTYRTGEADPGFATRKPASFQATPLVVDGTMYIGTPLGRVIALDRRRDVSGGCSIHRSGVTSPTATSPIAACRRGSTRGPRPTRSAGARIFIANAQSQLVALDARDGRPCPGFGRDGASI